MNKDINIIVEELTRSGKLNRLVAPFALSDCIDEDIELKKDFIQDLAIMLMQHKNPKMVAEMYERGELDFFIIGIIRKQVQSDGSKFYKDYGYWEKKRSTHRVVED